jgi:predicted flap endonuclease-1-like 5' DNA nuclease
MIFQIYLLGGKFMTSLVTIEGIGKVSADKLKRVGIRSTKRLLKVAAHRQGRKDLAEQTGLSEKLILEWVNLADLMRIKGIGEEYSDLLEEAGVDTVKELRNRLPDNLYKALFEINTKKRLVRRLPSLKQVKSWVKQAKSLPPIVTY